MGPEVPQPNEARGARRAQLGQVRAPEKKNSSSKRAGSGPRVFARGSGPDMEKPDPLPFLDWISIGSIRSVFSCFQFLRTKEIRDNQKKKKPISLYFPTFSQHPNTKQTNKKKLKIMYSTSIDPAHPTRRVLGGLNGCLGRVRVQYFGSALGSGPTRPNRSLKQNTHTTNVSDKRNRSNTPL